MRLLYLCSDFGITSSGTKGAAVHVRAITRALAELGHEVLFLSPKDGPGSGHPAKRVLPAGCPPVDKPVKNLKRWLKDRNFEDSVAKELRPLLYNAWVLERAKEVLADDPPEVIIERMSLFGHAGIDLADSLGVPLVLEVNAPLAEEAERHRNLQLVELAKTMERRVLDRADAVAVVSGALADRFADCGVDRNKIHVLPNGVDMDLFGEVPSREACRRELGLVDEFAVGFVGSLKQWHGVDVLVAAFKLLLDECPAARLYIIGTGPVADSLRQQAKEGSLNGAITFTGAVPHDQVPRLLGALDVAVAPFREVPGFYFSPIKLFEYMASGTCVVGSRLGQIAEVIDDGVNGILVEPDNVSDLGRALLRVRRSPEWRRRAGVAAREKVRSLYTWSHTAKTLSDVLESVVEKGRRSASCSGGRETAEIQRGQT